jgi:hypothetical protein
VSILVERFLGTLEPGDTVNVDAFEEEHGPQLRRVLLDELEGRGFVLDSRVLGTRCCPQCDGESTTVNHGRGKKPYRQ